MFGIFKKLADTGKNRKFLNKSFEEYKKILALEEKRLELQKKYGTIDKTVQLQKEMIHNNFLTLARVVQDKGGFENTPDDMANFKYFNIQGTKPNIMMASEYGHYTDSAWSQEAGKLDSAKIGTFKAKDGSNQTFSHRVDFGIFWKETKELIELEEKFINLRHSKIKENIKTRLASKAEQKINQKVQKYSELFGENSKVIAEYIFSGLKGEDDHYHNIHSMKERLNAVGMLSQYIMDSKEYSLGPKELIYVFAESLKDKDSDILKLLERINNIKYDFVIAYNKG